MTMLQKRRSRETDWRRGRTPHSRTGVASLAAGTTKRPSARRVLGLVGAHGAAVVVGQHDDAIAQRRIEDPLHGDLRMSEQRAW